ncbi:MAG: TPM domain-containing protein [Lachnospiraceae bacterium]|nr:TPM domain-containing protein [Lachnospiraceae bacterium]
MKRMKRISVMVLAIMLMTVLSLPVFAASEYSRLQDSANLLSDSEKQAIESRLDKISEAHNVDVVLATFETMPQGYSDMEKLADDFYEVLGYGYGSSHDGVALVLVMDKKKWQISTEGYGITAFTDAGIQYIGEQVTSYIKESDYNKAFNTYCDLADDFITQAKAGHPVTKKTLPKAPFGLVKALIIAVVAGLVIAFIAVGGLSAQLKSVRFQASADFYTKQGSLNLTNQRDTFLFTTVSRTEKPKSSGGSSTHTSSSGRTHGGGGGGW